MIANFGVVIGIFILVVEVRQNQAILEETQEMNLLTARSSDIQQYQEWRSMLIQDEELVRIWTSGIEGEQTDPIQHTRFMLMCLSTLWADASMYERTVVLERDGTTAQTIASELRDRIQSLPGYKSCWEATRESIRGYGFGDFVDAVDTEK